MATPSLAMIPSGYKATKLYSVLPTDGTGDFDFSRSGSATRINKDGLIETVASNVPRLNYPLIDGVVQGCPSLLLEPSRTNLVQYSEDISNSVWTALASGENIVSNSVISPDGTLNADTLEGDGSSKNVYVRLNIPLNTSTDYTFSIFAKKGTNNFLAIQAQYYSGATNTTVIFDLNNGVVTTGTANIEDYGNGWFRCSYTIPISTDGTGRFLVSLAYNDSTRGFPTSSDANGQNIYLWGGMVEEGSYQTSYIPSLTGSQTTRSAETCNNPGDADTFNDSEGVLFAEISALANDLTNRGITISDGSENNRVTMFYTNVSNAIQVKVDVGGSNSLNSYIVIPNISLHNKFALKYKQNDFSLFVNGFELIKETIGNTFSNGTLTKLAFDNGDAAEDFYGNTKQLQYFDTALTDSELETLTSWVSFSDMANGQLYTIQ